MRQGVTQNTTGLSGQGARMRRCHLSHSEHNKYCVTIGPESAAYRAIAFSSPGTTSSSTMWESMDRGDLRKP
ncbi:hypothetical protein Taro_002321 [Colocasia esculenta]|uniref:Uncharacterized protein n=1 Tax=Colocasia esculenta TaxID=4460 RepID=A0A843TKI6_COLES|nr:hypothetical protein [Colocasia esculenta]